MIHYQLFISHFSKILIDANGIGSIAPSGKKHQPTFYEDSSRNDATSKIVTTSATKAPNNQTNNVSYEKVDTYTDSNPNYVATAPPPPPPPPMEAPPAFPQGIVLSQANSFKR